MAPAFLIRSSGKGRFFHAERFRRGRRRADCGVECVGVIGAVGIKLLVPVPRG